MQHFEKKNLVFLYIFFFNISTTKLVKILNFKIYIFLDFIIIENI